MNVKITLLIKSQHLKIYDNSQFFTTVEKSIPSLGAVGINQKVWNGEKFANMCPEHLTQRYYSRKLSQKNDQRILRFMLENFIELCIWENW